MRILIAYDGSERADGAIDDLRRAGMPRKADVLVVSVAESWFPISLNSRRLGPNQPVSDIAAAATRQALDPLEESQQLAIRASERILSYFSEWEVLPEAALGSPAREILKKAAQWRPDLIVVGAQGRSALSGFFLGSVSQKIVNEATCSVRVARGVSWKEGAPVRIIIGLDGHPVSEAAIGIVAARPWPPESLVRVVTVVDSLGQIAPSLRIPGPARPADLAQGSAGNLPFITAAVKRLTEAELIVSTRVEEGDPKQVLVADADEWGADCIFIGSSCSHTGMEMETRLLGSVSTAIVARAHCSVEVVRCLQENSAHVRT